jgi:monothiol glutaredoxin
MSARPLLPSGLVSPGASDAMARFEAEVVRAVAETVARDAVVVVGMAQNPHVKNVRKALARAGIPFTYIGYGSYFSKWRERLAIKLWSGWPTFPQVFVKGTLLGGEDLTLAAIASGALLERLDAPM